MDDNWGGGTEFCNSSLLFTVRAISTILVSLYWSHSNISCLVSCCSSLTLLENLVHEYIKGNGLRLSPCFTVFTIRNSTDYPSPNQIVPFTVAYTL